MIVNEIKYEIAYNDKLVIKRRDDIIYYGDIVIPGQIEYEREKYKVIMIEQRAFFGSHITSIVIPEQIKGIYYYSFQGCLRLKKVTLPEKMNWLGWSAFQDCCSLEQIIIPEGIPQIDRWTFMNCKALQQVIIPKSVLNINEYAFIGCDALETVKVHKHCLINDNAFNNNIKIEYYD